MHYDTLKKVVKEHFEKKMTPEIKELARLARWDLWNGPHSGEDYAGEGAEFEWPGYSNAIDKIQEWCNEELCDVWVCVWSEEVFESQPEDDNYADYVHVERSDTKRFVFGELVGNGL